VNDTTTTLNTGTGGDKMDESLVTQSDGVTQAKRTRIVIGGDASGTALVDPIASDPGKNPYSVPALATAVVDESTNTFVDGEVRRLSLTTEGRLRVAAVHPLTGIDFFGDAPSMSNPDDFHYGVEHSSNPFDF
jgi:hypothetical protein